jgi:hypothetical protein
MMASENNAAMKALGSIVLLKSAFRAIQGAPSAIKYYPHIGSFSGILCF